MTISSKEQEAKKVSITVDRDPVSTSFEKWAQPGHFSRTLAKGPKTTTWIWNLHADAHDFDSHTSSLEDISRKIFSAHFGQLSIIFLWLSGMYFHGARFSNYSAWLGDSLARCNPDHWICDHFNINGKKLLLAIDLEKSIFLVKSKLLRAK